MKLDQLTRLHVSGFKSLSDVNIPLHGLTVLIGENGAGKSAILEALLILASAAERVEHVQDVIERRFGRFERILCKDNPALHIEGTIKGSGEELHYGFCIGSSGSYPMVLEEWLYRGPLIPRTDENRLIERRGLNCKFRRGDGSWEERSISEQALAVGYLGAGASESIARLLASLESIQIHPPFDSRPIWQQRDLGFAAGPRWPHNIEPASRLARYAVNLPSAYHQLRNAGDETWERVLNQAKLGLGEDLREIRLPVVGRGAIELELQFSTGHTLSAEVLSEGQICYLAFIALTELGSGRSLLAVDEPELHLHPGLLTRVLWALEATASHGPVVVATHSDRLLDALAEPAKSVLLCELDETRRTVLRRPNAEALTEWLKDYSGLGAIRAEGNQEHVFADAEVQASSEAQ